mmetsp:Transcript_9345/g.14021  ORF Transcript_9345/g.14021 Transcript_9345/m.14021 type:complete len:257 (-) Transcript_9345:102-872(-)
MAAELLRSCNVCGAGASKLCSRCKLRKYCGAECQRRDWQTHKRYCQPPAATAVQIESLKEVWLGIGGDNAGWQELLQKASADGGKAVEPSRLRDMVTEKMKEGCPAELFEKDGVGYSMDVVKQLGVLPSLPLVDDEFVMSYSTFGQMETGTGELLYCIACLSNRRAQVRATGTSSGAPDVVDCESVLFEAMIKPMPCTGDPMRPTQVLLAHRWGAQAYDALRPFLLEHGIGIRLETAGEARRSAEENGMDPSGFNV